VIVACVNWLSEFFWGRFSRVGWIFSDTTGEIIGTDWEDLHGFFGKSRFSLG